MSSTTSVMGPRTGPLVVPGSSLIHWGTSLAASVSACLARVISNLQMDWDFVHLAKGAETGALGAVANPEASRALQAATAGRGPQVMVSDAPAAAAAPASGGGPAGLSPIATHRQLLESAASLSPSAALAAGASPAAEAPLAAKQTTTPWRLHTLPFSMSHSYVFFLLTHAIMGLIALALYGVMLLVRRLAGLPSYRVLRLRLQRKGGRPARSLAYVLEQFDDVMIDGALHPSPAAAGAAAGRASRRSTGFGCRETAQRLWNSSDMRGLWEGSAHSNGIQTQRKSSATGESSEESGLEVKAFQRRYVSARFGVATVAALGLVSVLNILFQYFWLKAIKHTAAPLTQVVNAGFIIYLPVLASVMLKEPLHGLKLFSSISSFVGVYLCYFSTVSPNPSSSTFKEIVVGTAQSLTGALCLALYLVLYKYCNPNGWMLLVIGIQELAASAIGFLMFPLFRMWGNERLGLPQTMEDFSLVVRYAGESLVLNYCINEAIRWGDPSSISAALVLAPALDTVLKGLLFKTVPLNAGRIMALVLTLLGFAIDALYQYGQTLKRRARRAQLKATQLHFYRNQYEEELNDAVDEVGHQTKLLSGNEYII